MTAPTPQGTSPTPLADLLSRWGAADGRGALLDVPSAEAWTTALPDTPVRPGDRVVMTRTGDDSAQWASMAADLGYDVVCIDVPAGDGPSLDGLTHLLWWDTSVKAVFVARDETSTGVAADVSEVRRAMDLAGSDALLLVDCSAAWVPDGMPQGAWSADLVVTDLATRGGDPLAWTLLSWSQRLPALASIKGALDPSDDVVARARCLVDDPEAPGSDGWTRRSLVDALRHGLTAAGLPLVARGRCSDVVTVVHLPGGIDATRFGQVMAAQCRASTDLGVGTLVGRVLRLWHTELRDEVDVLAVVSTVELALSIAGAPGAARSGLEAARAWLEAPRADVA